VCRGLDARAATEFSYAVSFVCGTFTGDDRLEPVVPGVYLTAFSIGNRNEERVELEFDVAFTFGSVPFPSGDDELGERDARRLDCDTLFGNRADPPFLKGILYVVAGARLDVWAFYTALEPGADQIAIDAVQVLGRRLDGKSAGRLAE
jgi:hypothetical protein